MNDISIILMVGFTLLMLYAFFAAPRVGPSQMKPVLSAYSLVLILYVLNLLFPGFIHVVFDDSTFFWAPGAGGPENTALTTTVVAGALIVFLIAYRVHSHFPRTAQSAPEPHPEQLQYLVCASLIGAGVVMKIAFIASGGGLETTVMRTSHGVSEALNLSPVSASMNAVRTASGVADAAVSWLVATQLAQRRSRLLAIAVFLFVILLTYSTAGKRLFLLWPMLCLLVSIHVYYKPLRMRLMPVILLSGFALGFASLMARIYLPSTFSGSTINLYEVEWAQGSLFHFYANSLEFAGYELVAHVIQNTDQILAYFGDWTTAVVRSNFEPVLYLIPRALWPDKPDVFVDYSTAVAASLFGGSIDNPTFGVAATLVGTAWGFGGLAGLVVAMWTLGWICGAIDSKYLSPAKLTTFQVITYTFFLVVIFHLFRQATVGWVFMIAVMQQYGMIAGFLLIKLADIKSAPVSNASSRSGRTTPLGPRRIKGTGPAALQRDWRLPRNGP